MKYTIMGFSQKQAIKYNLDLTDLTILRWFVDFRGTNGMAEEIYKNKVYYWIDYKSLLNDIPIIGITSKIVLRRRLKNMVDNGILIHYTKKKNGVYSFYNLGKNYKDLVSVDNSNENDTFKLKSLNHKTQKFKPLNSKVYTKDYSIKDKSIKKYNNNTEKKEKTKTNVLKKQNTPKDAEITEIVNKIENKLNRKVNKNILKKFIKNNSLKDIYYYLDHWEKFDHKEKKDPIAFLLHLVKVKAEIPKIQAGYIKPEQSYNFDQRKYDDEFFDNLYEVPEGRNLE